MTTEERKEWEILCRQYNVDSLYEAIEGCQEELEFLQHCAARLEPRSEEDDCNNYRANDNYDRNHNYNYDHDHNYDHSNDHSNDHRLQTTPFNTSTLRRFSSPAHAVSHS